MKDIRDMDNVELANFSLEINHELRMRDLVSRVALLEKIFPRRSRKPQSKPKREAKQKGKK